jgi:hypothetical protein
MKRKAITQGQGSSGIRPRYALPQGTPAHPGGGPRPAQYALQGTPQTPRLVRLPPLAPRRGPQARRQALHASSAVRLGTMQMLVQWGIQVHQLRTSNGLLAMYSTLLGLTKSVSRPLLMVQTSLSVWCTLMQFQQHYYLILELRICLFLLDLQPPMNYHYKI